MRLLILLLLITTVSTTNASEIKSNPTSLGLTKENSLWTQFEKSMKDKQRKDYVTGLSYVISGGIGTIGGLIGYYSTSDPIAKAVFALTQSIGIGATGYGFYTLNVGNEDNQFYNTVLNSKSLTSQQRDELATNYLNEKAQIKKNTEFVKAVTHGLIALLNGYNATRESNGDLRTSLYFLTGINALVAISYVF